MRRLAPLFFVLLLFAACGAPTGVARAFTPGEPFWLALGDSAAGTDGGAVVRFAAVVADSRCPPDAVCVWAGQVTVDVGVRATGGEEVVARLNTLMEPKSAWLDVPGRRIELLEVEGGDGRAPAQGYRARLLVTLVR